MSSAAGSPACPPARSGWYRIAVAGTPRRGVGPGGGDRRSLPSADRIGARAGPVPLAREFVPGEPLASTAHVRHFPVLKVAAGLPAVTAEVGDRRGFHIAETAGLSARAVCFDPWYLPEIVEVCGVVPIVGAPGSGKSMLMGLLCYKSALSGVRGVCDGPGRAACRRCWRFPSWRRSVAAVDVMGGRPGSLSPYAAVPEPNQALVGPSPPAPRTSARSWSWSRPRRGRPAATSR